MLATGKRKNAENMPSSASRKMSVM